MGYTELFHKKRDLNLFILMIETYDVVWYITNSIWLWSREKISQRSI